MPADSFDALLPASSSSICRGSRVPELCEFFRLLRLKGQLLLTTPNPHYLKNRLKGTSVLGGSYISQHYIGNLRRRLEDVGFPGIKIRGSGRCLSCSANCFPHTQSTAATLPQRIKW